jgi:hypothetical protein
LCGEENKPDISSSPFSSRRRCGNVIPVRLQASQRAPYAMQTTERTVQLCPHRRSHCYALGAPLVEVPSFFVGKLNASEVEQPQDTTSSFAGMALKDDWQLMLWLSPESGIVEDRHARP